MTSETEPPAENPQPSVRDASIVEIDEEKIEQIKAEIEDTAEKIDNILAGKLANNAIRGSISEIAGIDELAEEDPALFAAAAQHSDRFEEYAQERIRRARSQLLSENPFFGFLLMNIDMEPTTGLPTAAVVEKTSTMYYRPYFINSLSEEQVQGAVCHEILHLALQHFLRQGTRDIRIWNLAIDTAVNYAVLNNGMDLPETVPVPGDNDGPRLILPDLDEDSMTYSLPDGETLTVENVSDHTPESLYDILNDALKEQQIEGMTGTPDDEQDNSEEQDNSDDGEQGSPDDEQDNSEEQDNSDDGEQGSPDDQPNDAPGDGDEDFGQEPPFDLDQPTTGFDQHCPSTSSDEQGNNGDKNWDRIVSKALQHARDRGDMPNGISELVENVVKSERDWRSILHDFITDALPYDFTYSRPSKLTRAMRAQGQNVYLPDTDESEEVDILVALDTSGSIRSDELREFVGEIASIVSSFEQANLVVIQHTSEVTDITEYENATEHDFKQLEAKDRGGTNHIPVFEKIEEEYPRAKCLVAFSDGDTRTPENPPHNLDVLWAINNHRNDRDRFGFGRVIRVTDN